MSDEPITQRRVKDICNRAALEFAHARVTPLILGNFTPTRHLVINHVDGTIYTHIVYYNAEALKDLKTFVPKFITPAMESFAYRLGNAQLSVNPLTVPKGLPTAQFIGAFAFRLVLDEQMTYWADVPVPRAWSHVADYYDVSRDLVSPQMVCPAMAFSVFSPRS